MDGYDDIAAQEAQQRSTAPQADDTYDTMAAAEAEQQDRVLRASLNVATQTDPVKAGDIQALASKTGLPHPVIERNEDYVAQQQRARELYQAMQDSPILARQMSDPVFAKIAQDDTPNLTLIEQTTRVPTAALKGLAGGFNRLAGTVNMTAGAFPVAYDWAAGKLTGEPQTRAQDAWFSRMVDPVLARQVAFDLSPDAGLAEKTAQALGEVGAFLAQVVATGGGGMAASAATAVKTVPEFLALAATHGVKAMALPALSSAVEIGHSVFAATGNPAAAAKAAMAQYAITSGMGIAPLSSPGGLLKRLFGGFVSGAAVSEASRQGVNAALPEGMQAPFSIENLAVGGLTGSVLGGAMGPRAEPAGYSRAIRQTYVDAARAEAATTNADALGQLAKLSDASKVRARDADTFQKFVEAAAEDGPVQDIYVSAAKFEQAAGDRLDALRRTMPSLDEQLPAARATDGEIAIPLSEFAAHVPAETQNALLDHIRTDPDAMTRAEAATFMQQHGDEIRAHAEKTLAESQATDASKASAANVEADLLKQLTTANRFTKDVNEPYSKLAATFYTVQAARLGITPEEMYSRYPLKITAQTVTDAAAKAYDQTSGGDHGSDRNLDFTGINRPANENVGRTVAGTPAREGFEATRIRGRSGSPLRVFRGATAPLAAEHFHPDALGFNTEHASSGLGVFFSTSAATAAKHGEVAPFHLDIRNPKEIKADELPGFDSAAEAHAWREQLRAEGYDGLLITAKHLGSSRTDIVAFDPEQVILPRTTFDQPARGQITFGADITQSPSVISLLKDANLSTFLHEMGHFQLQVLADLASRPGAHPGIAGDMQALLKWFGVKDLAEWNAMSTEQQRPYHEQLAQGFETYLMEGKAPSIELQGIFSRMRAWLLNVYRKIGGQLSPEVRGVFDRMLATNEEILAAEHARGMQPLFQNAEQARMTPDEWQAYQAQSLDATQTAIGQLQARSLRDMQWLTNAKSRVLGKLQREADAKRKAVEAEVTAEVRAEPVYQAWRFLAKGEITTNGKVETVAGAKLGMPALKAMYGEDPAAPWRYLPTNIVTNEKALALHPDTVAEMFGFTSGDELVRKILDAGPEQVAIEGITDQRMLERYGDLADPASIERATNAAIHNDARTRFVATELRALMKATGQRRLLTQAAKQFAEENVARKKVRDVRPAFYAAAEARAARASEKALIKGDLMQAAAEKRNQLVNSYAAKAAADALAEVDKGLAQFRRLDGNPSIDPEYRDQIDQMLERFDLRSGQSLKAIDKRTALAEWITRQEEMGFEPVISDELRNEAMRQSYKDMTVEEFRGLRDAVKNIEHLGRLKHKLLTAKDQRDFAEVVGNIEAVINANARKTLPAERISDRGALVSMQRFFRYAKAAHRKFGSLVRGFDGYQDGGVAWEYLVRNMNERGNYEAVENEKATLALSKMLGPIMKDRGVGYKGARIGDKFTQRQFFPSIGKSFSREERIGILLNMGNKTNLERMLTGERLSPEQLKTIVGTLSKADAEFANQVWEYLDTFRPEIGAKELRVTGVEPEWVQAEPFTLALDSGERVEMRGGYYPIAYDPLRSERSGADITAEVQRQIQQGLYTRAQTRRGHTKARVESTGRPLNYAFGDVITHHVTQVIHDLAWHEYLIDANRLLRSGAIEGAVKRHYGVEVLQALKDTLRDIAVGSGASGGTFASAVNSVRYGTTISTLAYNLFNTLQNLTGITQSISRIGPQWVFKGAAHWLGDAMRLQNSVAEIHGKSDFMRLRAKTLSREISEIRNQVSGSDSKIEASFFWLQNKTQLLVDVPTWWGGYEKAMAQDGMTESKAIALADQAVIDAQGSGQIKDLARVQRAGGALGKLFTTFYSYFNATYNLTAEAIGRTRTLKQAPLLAADILLLYGVNSWLSTLLRAAMNGSWDDPDKLAKRLASDQIGFLLGSVVGLREATAGAQAAFGVDSGFGYTGPAGMSVFSDLVQLGQQAHQGEADEAFWKSLNTVGGIVFHYPAGQINRTLSGINALNDGRADNPGGLIMGPPPKR